MENNNSKDGEPENGEIPLERHVFQTIFLDNDLKSSRYWSKHEIDSDKVSATLAHPLFSPLTFAEQVIMQKWWKQQSHRWQHYACTVPWMGLINGRVTL